MAKKDKKISKITIAKMLKLEPMKSVQLTSEFLEALKPEAGNYAVIILTPNTKIIRIIPTSTNKAYKIAIDIGKLTPDFLRRIGNLFLKLGVKALYSTGLCFMEEKCVFDGYIDSEEFDKIDVENLKAEIMAVEGITGLDITILEAE
ncbi:MAG: hypothetical protein KGD59_01455 [Candidatus Heimdallarchaeota archaeon]|nr:hypothetical protein [Candidatus Heimdallarchaeota archaeon]MBY8993186.1 hypothetical protein [Candidatus Heimdallarchaeota archaeon]